MAISKYRMRGAVKAQNLPSNSENALLNRAGGVAFEISDPSVKLITMTGGSFFDEPRYYDGDLKISSEVRQSSEKICSLAKRLECHSADKLDWICTNGVSSVTREIISTVSDIVQSSQPEDLLIIARWLRNEMNIRLTPQFLLVLASQFKSTQCFVRKYTSKIVIRPDEVKTCLLLHRYFFGHKTMKNCLAQGLSDTLSTFGERALLKYDSNHYPTWKDVVQTLPRKKNRPMSKEISTYFLSGNVIDSVKTPILSARQELGKKLVFDDEAKHLAKASFVNWEVLLSQFPNSKVEVWEFLISENLIGYMALLRNLRNILECNVSYPLIEKVSETLSNRENVLSSKQLPFRFYSAYKTIELLNNCDESKVSEVLSSIEKAVNISSENINLPGITAIFVDVSGSMNSPVSGNSSVSCEDVASVMGAIVAKASDRAYLFEFATDVRSIRYSKTDSVLGIANRFASGEGVNGHSTEAWKIPQMLETLGLVPDRVIVLSDMQVYNNEDNMFAAEPLCDSWQKYTQDKKDIWLHCIHLNGYGDTPVVQSHVSQIGSYSEKVFQMLLQIEGVGESSLPVIEQIRERFRL
jgi:60 kDa SS-A/Ro ribonucleoprotein